MLSRNLLMIYIKKCFSLSLWHHQTANVNIIVDMKGKNFEVQWCGICANPRCWDFWLIHLIIEISNTNARISGWHRARQVSIWTSEKYTTSTLITCHVWSNMLFGCNPQLLYVENMENICLVLRTNYLMFIQTWFISIHVMT